MKEETIFYKSPVGALQITGSAEAISRLEFVNKENKKVLDEDKIEYQKPALPMLKKCVKQLDGYFSGKLTSFDLSIVQDGTPFQQTVWNNLVNIPYGSTTSYLSLSKKIGNPKSIRAVGTANGRNNVAIIVPCHRVIGSNGSLVGYGGDLWRKKWLLEHEATIAHGVQTLF